MNHKISKLLIVILVTSCSSASVNSPPVRQANKNTAVDASNPGYLPNGNESGRYQDLFSATPVNPLVFSGSARELGEQHGSALSQEIHGVVDNWLKPIRNLIPFLVETFISNKSSKMVSQLPPEFLEEMEALARAAAVEEGLKPILLGNLTPDLMAMAQKPLGCSTFVVMPERSPSGGMIFGRNLDYAFSDYLRGQWRPIIFRKTGKHAILSLTVPGIVGIISGINDQGVAMTINMSHSKDPYNTSAISSLALFRSVLERANTAEEARDLYAQPARTIAVNVTITDGQHAYILEATPARAEYRSPKNGVIYAANHYEIERLGDGQHTRDFRWPSLQRFDNSSSKISPSDVRSLIADAGIAKTNVMAFILDYGAKKIYYGSDKTKAIAGSLKSVDLSQFLSKK